MMKRSFQVQRCPVAVCIDPLEPRTLLAVQLVGDLSRPGQAEDNSAPTAFIGYKGETYFLATTEIDTALSDQRAMWWKTNGTKDGTYPLALLGNGLRSSNYKPAELNGKLYLLNSSHLWVTDGTPVGTTMVTAVPEQTQCQLTRAGNLLYFSVGDPRYQLQLWRTDGTVAGTFAVTTFPKNTSPSEPVVVGNTVLFCRQSFGETGTLLCTDGTIAGTATLRPAGVKTFTVWVSSLTSFRNVAWFFADADGVRGLYRTDGTAAGTMRVRRFDDIAPTRKIAGAAKSIYFFVDDIPNHHYTLWKSDGTETGTVAVKDLSAEVTVSKLGAFAATSNRLFFFIEEEIAGVTQRLLWTSDGTRRGSVKVSNDIRAWSTSSLSGDIQRDVADGALYFGGLGKSAGKQGWYVFRSDGTPSGTVAVTPRSVSGFDEIATVANTLYFRATDGRTGIEPWRLPTPSSLSTIAGTVFNDLNVNGKRNSGERRLAGWRVYLDKNRDGRLNSGEKWQRTDSAGRYSFAGLSAGSYQVRCTRVAGWSSSMPATGDASFNVTLAPGDAVAREFGNVQSASTRAALRATPRFAADPFNATQPIHDLLADLDL